MQLRRKSKTIDTWMIDPTNMNPLESGLLFCLLEDEYRKGNLFVPRNFAFSISALLLSDSVRREFQEYQTVMLTHKLVRTDFSSSHKGRDDYYCYRVYSGEIVGHGTFATVEKMIGSLKPVEGKIFRYKRKKHAGKNQHTKSSDVRNEFTMNTVAEIKVDPPTQLNIPRTHKQEYYMTMPWVKGKTLKHIIKLDHKAKPDETGYLSTDVRIDITFQAILSLKRLHQRGVLHRDIKPENIMVNLSSPLKLRLIDYNLSCFANVKDKRNVGTPLYAPPECFDSKIQDESSDIFSLGRTLSELWRAEKNPALKIKTLGIDAAMGIASQYAHACIPKNLFEDINNLSNNAKNSISTMIHAMLKANPKERISLLNAMQCIEAAMLDIFLPTINDSSSQKDVTVAWNLAMEVREALDQLAAKNLLQGDIEKIHSFMQQAMISLPDKQVSLFLQRLDVKGLRWIFTKKEVMEKIIKTCTQYHEYVANFTELEQILSQFIRSKSVINEADNELLAEAKGRLAKIKRVMDRRGALSLTFDHLVLINQKFAKYYWAISREHEQFSLNSGAKVSAGQNPDAPDEPNVFRFFKKFFYHHPKATPPLLPNLGQ